MSDLFDFLNQAKQDLKDSFAGTCEAIDEGTKNFQKNHLSSTASNTTDNYVVHTEKEEVHNSLWAENAIHSNPQVLITMLNTINKICNAYVPASCKWDWKDITSKEIPKLAFYLIAPYKLRLKVILDSAVFFVNTDAVAIQSAVLKKLAKEIVLQVGFLQEQEAHNENFVQQYDIHTDDQLKRLHYDEDSLIKIAQLFSLVEQYPEARESLKGALDNKLEMAAVSQLEEQEVITYYNSCLKHYGMAKFYPTHVTYFDEHGLNRILFIQLRFAKKNGLINFTVTLFKNQIVNGNANKAMLKGLKSQIDNFNMEADLNKIREQKPTIFDKEKYFAILTDEMNYFNQISSEINAQLI